MQKYKVWTGFEPGRPGRKANTINTELKRILSNAVVRYCIVNQKAAMLGGVVSRNNLVVVSFAPS